MWSSSVATKLSHSRSGMRVDGAAELEEDGALVERELGVRVRHLHGPRRLARRPMPEPPLVRPARDVGDDVELLLRLLERALEPQVVVRRHDQLVWDAALAQERRQRREQPVDRLGLDRRLEPIVQLVPEATCAAHRRDVLADAGQVERPVARVVERRRQPLRERRRAREAEHRHDAARQQRLHDLVVHLRRPAVAIGRTWTERRVLAQDLAPAAPAGAGRAPRRAHRRTRGVRPGRPRAPPPGAPSSSRPASAARGAARAAAARRRATRAPRRCRRGVRARRRRRFAPRGRRGAAPRAAGSRPGRSRRRPGRRAPAPARARAPGAASRRAPPVGPCVRPRAAARTAPSRPALLHAQHVTGGAGLEHVRAEQLAQCCDPVLERCRRRPWRVLAPHIVDQALRGNDLPGAQEQRREDGALPQAAERQRAVVADDFERAEQPELEHGAFVPLLGNRCLTPRARERVVAGP